MSDIDIDRNTLRRYLLGELTQEAELAAVEERLLSEDDYFEEFELVKDDVVDQYVNQQLTPEDRRRFERYFLTTAERRGEVRQAQALVRYARKNRQQAK